MLVNRGTEKDDETRTGLYERRAERRGWEFRPVRFRQGRRVGPTLDSLMSD